MDKQPTEKPEWLREYLRIRTNPIYFLDLYYNVKNAEQPVELTDEERQAIFDQYKGVQHVAVNQREAYLKQQEKIKELKDQGYKDWEIF